jgi:hypothetical protein
MFGWNINKRKMEVRVGVEHFLSILKRFNLIKVFTLIKRMFTLTKNMGHEKHV